MTQQAYSITYLSPLTLVLTLLIATIGLLYVVKGTLLVMNIVNDCNAYIVSYAMFVACAVCIRVMCIILLKTCV